VGYYSAHYLAACCGGDAGVIDAAPIKRKIVRYGTGLVFITGSVQFRYVP
jgi:hypothetical protein